MLLMGKIALGCAGVAMAGAGVLCSEGFMDVNVVSRCADAPHHVHIIAPALLVPATLHFVPKKRLAEGRCEIQEWMPAFRAAFHELRKAEDFVLVEVKDHGQHVLVKKEGNSFVVDVEDAENTAHISMPIRAMESTFEELAAAAPREAQ